MIVCVVVAAAAGASDPGFEAWFSTELGVARGRRLQVQGSIPPYVRGMFVQSGPGRFDIGNMSFGHALDGFSKHLELRLEDAADGVRATFSTDFLQTGFYKNSLKENTIAPGMVAAETNPPSRRKLGYLNLLGPNDNNYIKPQFIGETELMTSDTNYVIVMQDPSRINRTIAPLLPSSLWESHWKDEPGLPLGHLCIQAAMAHGLTDPETGGYVTAMGCQAFANVKPLEQYHVIFRIDPSDLQRRVRLAKVPLPPGRAPSYMHQNGATERYHVLVGTPFHMDLPSVVLGKGLAQGGLVSPTGEQTLFQVVNKRDGSVREILAPGFLMGHVVNSYEEGEDIVLDLTHMEVETGGFFSRYLLSNMLDKEKRDSFPKSSILRFRLKPDGNFTREPLLPLEPEDDIELPLIHPGLFGKKYCVLWGVQFSAGGRSFASTALIKRNLCTGENVTRFEEGRYVSEHIFVPRPGADGEDDGALVGLVFDAKTGESVVEVVDARTLQRLATMSTGLRVPFPVHATWVGGADRTVAFV